MVIGMKPAAESSVATRTAAIRHVVAVYLVQFVVLLKPRCSRACRRSPGNGTGTCGIAPSLLFLVSSLTTQGADDSRLLAIAPPSARPRCWPARSTRKNSCRTTGYAPLSHYHLDHPFVFEAGNFRSEVRYSPAESESDLFGGNSNWRGPIWMPINYLFIESLNKYAKYFGDSFRVECPVGSGELLPLKKNCRRTAQSLDQHLSARQGRTASCLRRLREDADRPALQGLHSLPRILSR